MAKKRFLLTLAKLLVAAAWADGKLTNDEVNNLKDLLFRLPDLSAADWAELDIYMDSPVDEAERARLLEQFTSQLSSRREKKLAIRTLHELVEADGVIAPQEQDVIDDATRAIEAAHVGLTGWLGSLLQGPLDRRERALSISINREDLLEDFVRNKIFYRLQRRGEDLEALFELPEAEIRKLSLAGGLLARVAEVDQGIAGIEKQAIAEILVDEWGLSRQAAALVADVAASEIPKSLDDFRLRREFFSATTPKERREFLQALFAVAAADGEVSNEEVEEIRSVAHALKLSHRDFIRAKVAGKP